VGGEAIAPLGARGADLVVWWEQGFYPEEDKAVAEVITAFEQKTGKQVELVQHPHVGHPAQVQAALAAGQPPDFLWGFGGTTGHAEQWAYDDRLVDLAATLGFLRELFDQDLLERATLLNERTGERGLYTLPMGRNTNYVHVWQSLLERAGFTLADIPQEWDAFWAFWCDQVQPGVRKALGRDDIYGVALPMSMEASDTQDELDQFLWAHTPHGLLPGVGPCRHTGGASHPRSGARPLHDDL
jgi:multiple sugar transport system substrate-binding protein